jgi:hypothetical protein
MQKCAFSFAQKFQQQFGMQMAVSEFSAGTSNSMSTDILLTTGTNAMRKGGIGIVLWIIVDGFSLR